MERILWIASGLDSDDTARQLVQLVAGLPAGQFASHVCVLGEGSFLGDLLTAAAVDATVLSTRGRMGLVSLWQLRRLVRAVEPTIVHAWGPRAALAMRLTVGQGRRRVVSAPLAAAPTLPRWLQRWSLTHTDHVVASFPYEWQRCKGHGISAKKLILIQPGVDTGPENVTGGGLLGLPTQARLITCVGRLEEAYGFRDAIWAFDILKYVYDDLHLAIVGQGREERRLRDFARTIGAGGRVHFMDRGVDLQAILARTEIVWAPRLEPGPIGNMLEVMASGRPVVASRLPGFTDLITHEQTGLLFAPGDKVALARETRRLIEDSGLRRRLGQGARDCIRQQFTVSTMVERYAQLFAGHAPMAKAKAA